MKQLAMETLPAGDPGWRRRACDAALFNLALSNTSLCIRIPVMWWIAYCLRLDWSVSSSRRQAQTRPSLVLARSMTPSPAWSHPAAHHEKSERGRTTLPSSGKALPMRKLA